MLSPRILQRKLRNKSALAALFYGMVLLLLAACHSEENRIVEPIAHNDNYDIWPDSIDLHNDLILRAISDSLMYLRRDGAIIDSITAGSIPDNRMKFHSDYPLLNFLYRLEASTPSYGKYATQTPYEIYLNPLQNDSARIILESRIKNGLILPIELHHLGWPIINPNAEWLLAASELAIATDEHRFARNVKQIGKDVYNNDLKFSFNPSTNLFFGIPRYMATASAIFPSWMTTADLYQQSTLGINVAYCVAAQSIELSTDSVKQALKDLLWIPEKGYFSALTYGAINTPTPLQATDNLAQAIAIISGIFPDAMAEAIIRKTPVELSGVALFQPQLPAESGAVSTEISKALLQTAWTIAAARTDNSTAYATAVGSLLAIEGERLSGDRNRVPTFRSTFTSLILRGFAGMKFTNDGISFLPNIPETLPGEKVIENLHYRNSTLTIHINGTGRIISTFTIDGKSVSTPFFPASLEGEHEIAITLAGAETDPGKISIIDEPQTAPLPPSVTWPATNQASLTGEGNYQVYIDGILQDNTSGESYILAEARKPHVIQFCETDEVKSGKNSYSISGFSCQPYLYQPSATSLTINAIDIARGGSKMLGDKKLGVNFVESYRSKNRNIKFDFDAPTQGRYLVDIHYVNGLGIVNSQMKLALRQLLVDGDFAGVFYFSQRSAATAPRNDIEPWQEMRAWTNPLIIDLDKGENHLELRYFQPSPIFADPITNVILIDTIRLIPLS
jgi:hypothetical protein